MFPGEETLDEGSNFSYKTQLKCLFNEVNDIIINQLIDRFENIQKTTALFEILFGKYLN